MDDIKWSKNKLQEYIRSIITKMMEGTLDFVEVSVGNQERYKVLRSKLLRLGNDTLRSITGEIEMNYEVKYLRIGQDMIRITPQTKERKGKDGK